MSKRKKTVSKLKKQLDQIFSKYIRKRDKNICYTCGREGNQAGHYIRREINNTRYNNINVHAQCTQCNIFRAGNSDVYALRLIQDFGQDILQKLHLEKNILKQFSIQELEELIKFYKRLI